LFTNFPKEIRTRLASFAIDTPQNLYTLFLLDNWSYSYFNNEDALWEKLFSSIFPISIPSKKVLSLGLKKPWKALLYTYLEGKILYLSNRAVANMVQKWQNQGTFRRIYGVVADGTANEVMLSQEELDGIVNHIMSADCIIVHTDWPFRPKILAGSLGDAVNEAIQKGTGVINTLYTGCSFYECLGGAYHTNNYHPLVPRVEVNNTPGAQAYGTLNLQKIHEPEHFIFSGETIYTETYACGRVNPKGKLLAELLNSDTGEYVPGVMEIDVKGTKVISMNGFFSDRNSKFLMVALLYAAKKYFQE